MFEMANAVKANKMDTYTLESRLFEVSSDLKILLPFEVQLTSIHINGFELAETSAAGKITALGTTGDSPHTEVTFYTGDVKYGDTLRVAYRRRVNGASVATIRTNGSSARGALFAHWPVYSSGTDSADSAIKGYLHLFIPRVRVTALPGFDSSYKSAATNAVTFSALDPKRADAKMYDLTYEPLSDAGEIITTPTDGGSAI